MQHGIYHHCITFINTYVSFQQEGLLTFFYFFTLSEGHHVFRCNKRAVFTALQLLFCQLSHFLDTA